MTNQSHTQDGAFARASRLRADESGMAIMTAILVLMLASGLMAGMFAAVIADQRSHATDRDQTQAYAAAHAGLEKLTSNLGLLFEGNFAPTATQLAVIATTPPSVPGFAYTAPGGLAGSGYQITFNPGAGGNPQAAVATITTGPFEGLNGLITPYTMTVTARSTTGMSEVRLRRNIQTVAVPVFQFGIFGQQSIGFHAGPNFNFGGRVHTNATLHLASGNGSTLTLSDRITAVDDVIRDRLLNGAAITTTNHSGTVLVPTVIGGPPASYRAFAVGEDSEEPGWEALSTGTYNSNIRNFDTGARALNLPITSGGLGAIEIIRRPAVLSNEDVTNSAVFSQRFFSQASLRILLSDRASDITDLPTVTADPPVALEGNWNAAPPAGYAVAAGRPALARADFAPEVIGPFFPAAIFTRVQNIAAGPPITLTLQTSATGLGGWVNGVPPWLRVTSITINGNPLACTGMNATQLLTCPAHPAYAAGAPVVVTAFDGTVRNTTVGAAAAANAATITLAANTSRWFYASKMFFVGGDPVTCTGFTATTLTGCSVGQLPAGIPGPPANAAIAVNDLVSTDSRISAANTSTIGGFLKIEKQDVNGVWTDVTMEILNLGFAGRNQQGIQCDDPTPTAVIRLQRLRDNGMIAAGACSGVVATNYGGTGANATLDGRDYWPNTLYDAREGSTRLLGVGANMAMGGLFSYVAIDVNNFRRWVQGAIGATGNQAVNRNGYIVYFSDRRGDHNETVPNDPETGEYGYEDSLNPTALAWAADNVLNAGEDVNGNGVLDNWGATAHPLAVPAGALAPFIGGASPAAAVQNNTGQARVARQVLFRRALKVVNGARGNLPPDGFTVATENPIYVQGNYNADTANVQAEPNAPAALIGDTVTLLSNVWNDAASMRFPNDAAVRNATQTGYRFAMITGKAVPFAYPGWGVTEWGSDGGVHNFMRMLEDWGGGVALGYRGSMISLFFSRQAIGPYRADGNVYGAPTRGYNFDVEFLQPNLLPPGTPMFRDVNTLQFRQILRPNQ